METFYTKRKSGNLLSISFCGPESAWEMDRDLEGVHSTGPPLL